MKALTSSFTWAVFASITVALALSVVLAHAQTPGQIPVFDLAGIGSCNVTTANNCVDSVITQDASGNIGIGTTSPVSGLHVVSTPVASPPRLESSGTMGFGTLWDFYHGGTGKGSVGVPDLNASTAPGEMLVFGGAGMSTSIWAGGQRSITVNPNGHVLIGIPIDATGLLIAFSLNDSGVIGNSTNRVGVAGVTGNPNLPGVLATSAHSDRLNLGLLIEGRIEATGTRNAVVPLQDGQHVLLTAEESTEVWFSDYGTVQLVNGRAVVQIDPQYLQTVNTEKDYHVFLTARGNPKGSLYIDQETPSSFEIRESTGMANIKVSYRIVAKRKDFADERMKKGRRYKPMVRRRQAVWWPSEIRKGYIRGVRNGNTLRPGVARTAV